MTRTAKKVAKKAAKKTAKKAAAKKPTKKAMKSGVLSRPRLTVEQQTEALAKALGKTEKGRAASTSLARHPHVRSFVAKRQYAKYLADGGDPSNWQAFLDWLVKNLPTIIAMIMALFA